MDVVGPWGDGVKKEWGDSEQDEAVAFRRPLAGDSARLSLRGYIKAQAERSGKVHPVREMLGPALLGLLFCAAGGTAAPSRIGMPMPLPGGAPKS